jgi:hypothetical protein
MTLCLPIKYDIRKLEILTGGTERMSRVRWQHKSIGEAKIIAVMLRRAPPGV